jgi:ligand-binding SRPBCC domain-containing protein
MPVINLEILVNAPIDRVFDLARSIDLHRETMSKHDEKAIAGVTSGLINLGETVTWQATHFGVRQTLTSEITVCDRPHHFQDVMVQGAFAGFTHDHFLAETPNGTLMRDVFAYESPLWILGYLADFLFLEKYMTELLRERNEMIRRAAESEDWREFLK